MYLKILCKVTMLLLFVFCVHFVSAQLPDKRNSSHPIKILLNGKNTAQQFDGIGAVFSYEKLLYDYPEKQRSQILDYLFLPDYGAAMQILKVEVGYDGNNTTTAWPAHQRNLNEKPDYNRGFVWWLMAEAKKRNPNITLSGLHWGYPAYASTDELKADFIYTFVEGARKSHNLTIDYIGGNQNESVITPEVTKLLRKKLDVNGFNQVKIITADEGARVKEFKVLELLEKDKDYNEAVDVIGVHYKGRPASFMPAKAYFSGKPIWSSEDGGGTYKNKLNAYNMVDQFFKLFTDIKFSATLGWLATASAYDNMPWPTAGVIKSKQPWSGNYEIGASVWAIAHVTQFTQPGWKVLKTEDGYLYCTSGQKCGRYMGFVNPKNGDFSFILSTYDNNFPSEGIDLDIEISALKTGDLNVWRSDFTGPESEWFVRQPTVKPSGRSYAIHLDKNKVYSITTTSGQQKGLTKSPPPADFKLPYSDNFEQYAIGAMPRYFVDANGGFEVASAGGNRKGKVLRQMIEDAPLLWHSGSRPLAQPITEMGDMGWKNYQVEIDVLLEQPGTFWIAGRFDGATEGNGNYLLEGYWLAADQEGNWKLLRKDNSKNLEDKKDKGNFVTLASGKIPAIGTHHWANVSLQFNDDQITAMINHKRVVELRDDTYRNGNIALGCVNPESAGFFYPSAHYINIQLDNLKITQ